MLKTIDFYEIEENPSIVDDIFQQLIGQNIEFKVQGVSVSTIDILDDYLYFGTRQILLLFRNQPYCCIDYDSDGQIEIKFDDFLSEILVCYKKA